MKNRRRSDSILIWSFWASVGLPAVKFGSSGFAVLGANIVDNPILARPSI